MLFVRLSPAEHLEVCTEFSSEKKEKKKEKKKKKKKPPGQAQLRHISRAQDLRTYFKFTPESKIQGPSIYTL